MPVSNIKNILERVKRSTNTEDCTTKSCGQQGYCSLDLNGKFSCRCNPGYKGKACQDSKKLALLKLIY